MLATVLVFSPFIAFIAIATLGRFLGRQGSCIISIISMAIAFFLSLILFYKIAMCHNISIVHLATWFDVGVLHVSWEILCDATAVVMLVVISTISLLVHIYSTEYMAEDPHLARFMSYLSLFTFFMFMLVTSSNFVQLFFGWEGVGLASYLLINFWSTRIQANKSAIKAIVVNRIGDFGLGLGIFLMFYLFKSIEFGVIFACVPEMQTKIFNIFGFNFFAIDIIILLLFVGATGKSAQLGLHTWLPDAMEGPTPVSALIHAATMVTAGVFLLIRCSPILEYGISSLTIIACLGGLTCFFAATVGVVQNDLKRVIAYSTCSQLGYMIFACGLSSYSSSIFHLANHAFFKALLFLGAGAIIHALADEQDMRRMGGLVNFLPFTYISMLIGSLSLAGFPFLTGFYSKEHILEIAYSGYSLQSSFSYWLGAISALFTAFYSMRLLYITFLAAPAGCKNSFKNIHEPKFYMSITFAILIFGSIFIGYLLRDAFVGFGTDIWNNSILVGLHSSESDAEYIPIYIKLLPLIFTFFGIASGYSLYNLGQKHLLTFIKFSKYYSIPLYTFFSKRWLFDIVFNKFLLKNILDFSYQISFKLLDRGFIDYIGPSMLVNNVHNLSNCNSKIQSGLIYHHLVAMIVGLNLLLGLQLFLQNFITDALIASILFLLFSSALDKDDFC